MTNLLNVQIFSPGQIATIVVVSVLLALFIAANIVLAYLIHKRGERKLYDLELQKKREALLAKLKLMKEGNYDYGTAEDEEPEEEQESEAEEIAVIVDDGDAVEEEIEESTGKVIRYNRSFTARITQADTDLKGRYSELKNYILSYAGVKGSISWKHEMFRKGRATVAGFMVRGKTLCLCLAADPKLFDGTKYKVDDLTERSKNPKLPTMYKLKSDRKVGWAKELIDIVMEDAGCTRLENYKMEDFTLPYKSTEVLVKNKLIKVVGELAPDFDAEAAAAARKGIAYNRSFTARIIQSNDALKADYSELKNYMLSYGGVVDKSSWKREAYLSGKVCIASLMVRGKTLCLNLAADPERFKKTKYKVEDLSARSKNNKLPTMYRVNGTRKMQYAKELVDLIFGEYGLSKIEREPVDYAVPYVSTNNLIIKNLIRVTKRAPFKFRTEDEDENAAPATEAKKETPVAEVKSEPAAEIKKDEPTAEVKQEPAPEVKNEEPAAEVKEEKKTKSSKSKKAAEKKAEPTGSIDTTEKAEATTAEAAATVTDGE